MFSHGSSCLFCQCRHEKSQPPHFSLAADADPSPVFKPPPRITTMHGQVGARMLWRPQATKTSATADQSKASSKKLGTRGIAFHVLLCLCSLRSVVATPYFNLSRDSAGLEIVGHALRQLRRMNAFTFYRELIDWLLSNVTEENMFLIQSIATCCSLGWCVCSCIVCADEADTDALTKAPLASMAYPLETRS